MGINNNMMTSVVAMLDRAGVSFEEVVDGENIEVPVSALIMSTSDSAEKIVIIERAIDMLEADAYLKEASTSKLRDISKVDTASVKRFFKQMKLQFRKLLSSIEANLIPDAEFDKIIALEKMLQDKVTING